MPDKKFNIQYPCSVEKIGVSLIFDTFSIKITGMKTVNQISILLLFFLGMFFPAKAQNSTFKSGSTMTKTVSEITLEASKKIINYGLQLAAEKKLNLSFAITDRSGALLAFARMDDASLVTIEVAIQKARTAALLKSPSKVFEDFVNNGQPSMATTPGILPLQGGVPIIINNEIVGAVGVSGSSGENDNAMAKELANYLNK